MYTTPNFWFKILHQPLSKIRPNMGSDCTGRMGISPLINDYLILLKSCPHKLILGLNILSSWVSRRKNLKLRGWLDFFCSSFRNSGIYFIKLKWFSFFGENMRRRRGFKFNFFVSIYNEISLIKYKWIKCCSLACLFVSFIFNESSSVN